MSEASNKNQEHSQANPFANLDGAEIMLKNARELFAKNGSDTHLENFLHWQAAVDHERAELIKRGLLEGPQPAENEKILAKSRDSLDDSLDKRAHRSTIENTLGNILDIPEYAIKPTAAELIIRLSMIHQGEGKTVLLED